MNKNHDYTFCVNTMEKSTAMLGDIGTLVLTVSVFASVMIR